jgi:hypothetical protein
VVPGSGSGSVAALCRDVVATALADLRGIARLGGGHQLSRFLGVGLACTVAYVLLYLALRSALAALLCGTHSAPARHP